MRVMVEADVPFGMKLKNITKWNQLPADWKRFITLEPKGCFIAVSEDGEDVGTVTTTTYGTKLAWIGMVLVPPERRRQGIGTALLKKAISYLEEKRLECIGLDATPLGNKLYLTLGFREDFALERRQGQGQALTSKGVEKMKTSDLDAVTEFDAARFGVPRANVLGLLYKDYPELAWVAKSGGKIAGCVMMRPGFNAHQIGPWVASNPATAEELFKTALSAVPGRPIFFDVVVPNEAAMAVAKKYSFELQRPFLRMFLGENKYPADTKQMFAICGVEKG
jgi:ribosomal protein S18 acetylase RimI-like enzyme